MFPFKVRDIINDYQLNAKKSLSQNFLCDENILHNIVAVAQLPKNADVWEIGSGPGGLSMAILAQPINHLTMVEYDSRFLPFYDKLSAHYPDKITIKHANALKIDPPAPVHIVANIPYQITSDIILWCVKNRKNIASFTLMVQLEVSDRLCAQPQSKEYGRITIMAQAFFNISQVYGVPARAFYPPPKVDSMVIHGKPTANSDGIDQEKLEKVTQMAFQFRRKTLKNNFGKHIDLLHHLQIDPTMRPEELSVTDYIRITEFF